jgi:ABC-type multidrug transport system fused ATPase/permease subunit
MMGGRIIGRGGGPGLDHVHDVEGVAYNPRIARRALAYVGPYRAQIAVAVVLTLISAAANLLTPYLVKVAIDSHIAVGDLPGLSIVILIAVGVQVVNYVAQARQVMIVSLVGQRVLQTMRAQLFRHLMRLPLRYYNKAETGVIVSRVINDVVVMNDLLTNGLLNLFTDVVLLASTIAIMFALSPRLALVTFAVMPLMVIAVWVFTQRAKVAYRITREKIGALAADFQETLSGARVVQAFAREAVNERRFDQLNDENRLANINANTLSSGLMPVVEFTSALATVAVIWYGGSLLLSGDSEVTLGVIVAFLTYITRFFQPLRELTQFYNQLQAAMAGGERVFELLDEPVELAEHPAPVVLSAVRGDVEFRHVSFSYGGETVLHDLNLHAEPGQMVALVGHTGAGKTTAASLLARFYDPTQGAILLDGVDLRDLAFSTLRREVALVLQDNFLFSGTIGDNIRYGRLDATDEEVVAAARTVHAHSFIQRFPDGYDTPVMERAANLSLGQRQLIAIARAVLADPRVLILDEATSSVDPRTEALLQKALQRLLAGRTSLVIAHRLSTIEAADQVLMLEHGRLIEQGRHADLLARRGAYYRLYQQQFADASSQPTAVSTLSPIS